MKKSDVRIGMKVTPFRKSVGFMLTLENSYHWKKALEKGNKFLYVIGVRSDVGSNVWSLSTKKNGTHGDWFKSSDFRPYIPKKASK